MRLLQTLWPSLRRFAHDQRGSEAVENVMIIGLIALLCLLAVQLAHTNILQRWIEVYGPL